jgi:hypothetical protein
MFKNKFAIGESRKGLKKSAAKKISGEKNRQRKKSASKKFELKNENNVTQPKKSSNFFG